MKRFEFNKLIRSKLPDRMIQEGVVIKSKKLDDQEYLFYLKQKLLEEASEVVDTETISDLTRELADVLEVIFAIATANNIPLETVENERLKKLEINGNFAKEHYVHYIEVREDNKKVIDYLLNKNRPYNFSSS